MLSYDYISKNSVAKVTESAFITKIYIFSIVLTKKGEGKVVDALHCSMRPESLMY